LAEITRQLHNTQEWKAACGCLQIQERLVGAAVINGNDFGTRILLQYIRKLAEQRVDILDLVVHRQNDGKSHELTFAKCLGLKTDAEQQNCAEQQ
jgi:hypothetical protein